MRATHKKHHQRHSLSKTSATVGRLTFWFIYTIVSFVKSVLDYVAFVIPFYAEAEIALVVFLAFGGGAKMAYGLLRPILKQHEAGVPVSELAREHNVSTALIYQWRSKFGGLDASMMKRLKELEAENARLKKMYAEERLKAELRQEALEGKL